MQERVDRIDDHTDIKADLFVSPLCCRSRGDRQGGQGDVVYPIGYSEKPVPDTSIQETDKNLVEKVRTATASFY